MAVEMREAGRKLYVWTRSGGQQASSGCVIDCHGGLPLGEPSFSVPNGVKLFFYVGAGDVQSFNTEDVISIEDRKTYKIGDDLKGIVKGIFEPVEKIKSGQPCPDYMLEKIQKSSHKGPLGLGIKKAGFRSNVEYGAIKAMMEQNAGLDVVTIRDRWPTGKIMLSEAIDQLRKNGFGYAHIHCSFCRWKMSPRGAMKMQRQFPMPKLTRN